MDQLQEVTNIRNEATDSISPCKLKIKEESNFLIQSNICTKTKPKESESGFIEIAVTSEQICSNDAIGKTNKPMVKLEFGNIKNEVMEDVLDVSEVIEVNEQYQIKLDIGGSRIKTEPNETEEGSFLGKHFLDTGMEPDSNHSMTSNQVDASTSNSYCKKRKKPEEKGNEIHDPKMKTCHVCHRLFIYQSGLDIHLRIHTGEKPFECHICKKSFNRNSNLNKHMLVHSGEKPYACDICQDLFRDKSALSKHKMIHIGIKPFSCNDCGKSFLRKESLIIHQRMHTGDKPFTCDLCGKAFAQKVTLIQHRRTHTGFKPYTCPICQKSFTRKSSLDYHILLHKQ